MLIVVLLTGGFVIDAGPLRLSSHNWTTPLIGTVAAWLAAAVIGKREFGAAATGIHTFIDTHATALVIVISASATGVGVAYGTYSASGSDASGYVSQAQLLASGRVARDEPLARETGWPDATSVFSPLGYRAGQTTGEVVPTYPPGLPFAMAVALQSGAELAPFLVVPLLGALAVIATYALGARLHSRRTGVVASVLLATSPIFLFQIVQPMSDVPAAAWWTLAMLLALSPHSAAPIVAGVATGIAVLTRPSLIPMALPVAFAAMVLSNHATRTTRARRALAFATGTVPAVAGLLWLQWRLYGSPLLSGYGPAEDLFLLSNVMPNLRGYAARLVAGEASALALAVLSLAVLILARHLAGLTVLLRPALIASLTAAAVLIVYLPYGVFSEWSYLRFFLPALPCAFVLVAALLVQAVSVLPPPARGVTLLALVTAACSMNVTVASREQAFNLRRYEARYRLAGRYLETALPPNAVVMAVQQSGSARHYAHAPVVRWDLMSLPPEAVVSALREHGRYPVLLVEDWETTDIQRRFPVSALARLDWAPMADIGESTRVRLYDPADRTRAREPAAIDRLR